MVGAAAVVIIIVIVVVGIWLIKNLIDYGKLLAQFKSSTSVAVASQPPPAGTYDSTYSYRASLIPAAIGGSPVAGKILSLTVICNPLVTLSGASTTTPGYTAGIGAPVTVAVGTSPATAYSKGLGTTPVDLTFSAGPSDISWTRCVAEVKIEFPFKILFFTVNGTVVYKEYVPGPAPTGLGAPTINTNTSGEPP